MRSDTGRPKYEQVFGHVATNPEVLAQSNAALCTSFTAHPHLSADSGSEHVHSAPMLLKIVSYANILALDTTYRVNIRYSIRCGSTVHALELRSHDRWGLNFGRLIFASYIHSRQISRLRLSCRHTRTIPCDLAGNFETLHRQHRHPTSTCALTLMDRATCVQLELQLPNTAP